MVKPEQRKLRRCGQNMVARQHDGQARSKVRGGMNQNGSRHRVMTNVYDSARRRPWPRVNTGNATEGSRLDFVNLPLRQVVKDLPMKRAANEKKCRALMLSLHRRNEVAHLLKLSAARHRNNRKAEGKKLRKERRRQDHNSFDAIRPAFFVNVQTLSRSFSRDRCNC